MMLYISPFPFSRPIAASISAPLLAYADVWKWHRLALVSLLCESHPTRCHNKYGRPRQAPLATAYGISAVRAIYLLRLSNRIYSFQPLRLAEWSLQAQKYDIGNSHFRNCCHEENRGGKLVHCSSLGPIRWEMFLLISSHISCAPEDTDTHARAASNTLASLRCEKEN